VLTIEEITKKLTPVFEENGVTKAVLFGSYAKGTATEVSDVDLVIDTLPEITGWSALAIYGRITDVMDSLDTGVDIIHKMDIANNGRIDIEVARTGKVIYEREG